MTIQLYYTLRSPYCYLATPRLEEIERQSGQSFEVKHVYPQFVRDPEGVFADHRPMRGTYALLDIQRTAARLGMPLAVPRPDPVVQHPETSTYAAEQPEFHILKRAIHMGVVATRMGKGLRFVSEVTRLMWSGECAGWNEDENLGPALARAGLVLAEMDRAIVENSDQIERQLEQNAVDQLAAGHWGTPLMVLDGEPFFGQDRIQDLVWRLERRNG